MRRYRNDDIVTLSFLPVDQDGQPVELIAPVTATVYRDGVEVDAGDATVTDSALTYDLATDGLPLDQYTVLWAGNDGTSGRQLLDKFELTGGFLCEITDIQAQPLVANLDVPVSDLRAARTAAEEHIEQLAMCAFVPRGARQRIIVSGSPRMLLLANVRIRRLYSVTVDGVALSDDELAGLIVYDHGAIERDGRWADRSVVTVHYEHGSDEAPGAIAEGCARHAARFAVKNQLGGRRTLESTDIGTMRVTYGTRAGETGDADLDAAIADFGARRPVVG